MTPTNKLRFVERTTPISDTVYVSRTVRILQQRHEWDVTYPRVSGEWRDVPIEKEQE